MRPLTLLLFAFIALPVGSYAQAPYKIKSCRIEFAFTAGGFQKGLKTLIFTDSGHTEKMYGITYVEPSAYAEMPKELTPTRSIYRTLVIQTPDSVFSVDLDQMTGFSREKVGYVMPDFIKSQMKKIREDSFLNKRCDVMDFSGATLWYWNGIVLKKTIGNMVLEYATLIDEDYIIKEDEFKLPKGVKRQ